MSGKDRARKVSGADACSTSPRTPALNMTRLIETVNGGVEPVLTSHSAVARNRNSNMPVSSASVAMMSDMRIARTCYDHLAGRSAVALLGALLERKALVRDDGRGDTAPVDGDPSAGPARVVAYQLTEKGDAVLGE